MRRDDARGILDRILGNLVPWAVPAERPLPVLKISAFVRHAFDLFMGENFDRFGESVAAMK